MFAAALDTLRSSGELVTAINIVPQLLTKDVVPSLLLSVIIAAIAWEQSRYLFKRWQLQLTGPLFVLPFLGGIAEMVRNPYAFWERQRLYAPIGASCNYIVGLFIIFVTDADAVRKVLTDNGAGGFIMALHPSGERILGPHNIAFMHGPKHKALRHSFLPLFSRKALGMYLHLQERLIRAHMEQWGRTVAGTAVEMRNLLRDLNQETSQTVFVGPYVDDPVAFSKAYTAMTNGFLALPFYFPGTTLWNAVRARERIVVVLTEAARRAKAAMAEGGEPRCLIDVWAQRVNEILAESKAAGTPPPEFTSDWAMGDAMMDFLFASQDASTASLTWGIHYLSEKPELLARVRAEQAAVRPNGEPLTYELLEKMTFARCVVKEILRYIAPAPMVPNVATADIKLTDTITVTKGSLVMPSLVAACRQGFPNPDVFDPDRFDPAGRDEGAKFQSNFLAFGVGAHYCVGREYAMNHLVAFIALFSGNTWERVKDGKEGGILYLPTLYPESCIVRLAK